MLLINKPVEKSGNGDGDGEEERGEEQKAQNAIHAEEGAGAVKEAEDEEEF